jgi:hypothetical protein
MSDFAPAVKAILIANGCEYFRRRKRDYDIWHSPKSGNNFRVDSKILSPHRANDILKKAGLPKRF